MILMIAIDTNVLVRVLINEPTAQAQCLLARDLISKHKQVWISQLVLIETVWVLSKAYQFEKQDIILVLEKLIQHPHIYLENEQNLHNTLTLFSASNVGFADCLILNQSQTKNLILYTFDRKLSRLHGAKQVIAD
jgi:predicted nucleic-acid-binding protein